MKVWHIPELMSSIMYFRVRPAFVASVGKMVNCVNGNMLITCVAPAALTFSTERETFLTASVAVRFATLMASLYTTL